MTPFYFVITFKIHRADVKTIFRQTPDVCQDPKLEVSHSCHDVIQMSRRKPTRTIRKWPEEAQDTMREDTETKQGSTVDKASRSSQVKPGSQRMVSSCRRSRSHDEPCGRLVLAVVHPLMLSSISSSTPTLCITAPDSCYSLCTTVQRSTEVSLDLDPSTPRIQLRRRMQRTRMSLSRWTLSGSDPAEELPAGAGGRIQEVGDCFKTLLWFTSYQCQAIYFLFMPL